MATDATAAALAVRATQQATGHHISGGRDEVVLCTLGARLEGYYKRKSEVENYCDQLRATGGGKGGTGVGSCHSGEARSSEKVTSGVVLYD